MHQYTVNGSCHCGAQAYELATNQPPAEIQARACDCRFCRIHGSRNWSDPNGRVLLRVTPDRLHKYRFGLRTADFFLCRTCGAYVAAVLDQPGGCWSTVNLRLCNAAFPENPAHYGPENAVERVARRQRTWTPTHIELLAVD